MWSAASPGWPKRCWRRLVCAWCMCRDWPSTALGRAPGAGKARATPATPASSPTRSGCAATCGLSRRSANSTSTCAFWSAVAVIWSMSRPDALAGCAICWSASSPAWSERSTTPPRARCGWSPSTSPRPSCGKPAGRGSSAICSTLAYLLICITVVTAAVVGVGFYHVYFDRTNLPDIEPFTRFEFPTIGHVYDANGQPLIEMAREYRRNINYEDIPSIVRDAILATEDKNFFTHGGVDYSVIPRVLRKVRIGTLVARLTELRREDEVNSPAIFPHGGSTITQQLVRGHFLKDLTVFQNMTAEENSNQLRHGVLLPRVLSYMVGSRSVNMLVRKLEEIRLSLWVENKMQERFGSKRRAKEEILARYASFIYMGNGQYGFAAAAEYYLGRPLATL